MGEMWGSVGDEAQEAASVSLSVLSGLDFPLLRSANMSVALYLPFVMEGCSGSRSTGLQQRTLGAPLGPLLRDLGDSMLQRSPPPTVQAGPVLHPPLTAAPGLSAYSSALRKAGSSGVHISGCHGGCQWPKLQLQAWLQLAARGGLPGGHSGVLGRPTPCTPPRARPRQGGP